jgi:hypothetical protein
MQAIDLQKLLIQSCQRYYKYQEEKGKGRSVIPVHEIGSTRKQGIWSLRLAERIFDLDAITFEFPNIQKKFSTEDIKVVEYDHDNRILIVKPQEKCDVDFSTLQAEDITIVSDLKFLIERLREYYKVKGDRLNLPDSMPDKLFNADRFDYLPDCIPSGAQKDALNTIFHYPLSYIWGAPGTGKTQFVLANSLLKYIREHKRIAIFAPTNVALEQVLIGIINFTDKAGIVRDKILRIGNPSRNFATTYPEVCEVLGVEKQIRELTKQIQILKGILGVDDLTLDSKVINKLEVLFAENIVLKKEQTLLVKRQKQMQTDMSDLSNQLETDEKELIDRGNTIYALKQKSQTFFGRLLHNLFPRFDYEKRIAKIERIIRDIEEDISANNLAHANGTRELRKTDKKLKEIRSRIEEIASDVRNSKFNITELQGIWDSKGLDTSCIQLIKEQIENLEAQQEKSSLLLDTYSTLTKEDLQNRLAHYLEQLHLLEGQSTAERLKDVKVVGATLDSFIGRFTTNEVEFAHVFVDEAAYCNVTKALIVFTLNAPITFLGDHKQLPPVTEMKKEELIDDMEVCFPWLQSSLHAESFFHKPYEVLLANLRDNKEQVFTNTQRANLNETHRFGQNLASVLDKYVYKNGFKGKDGGKTTEIIVIHADKVKGSKGRENPSEVKAIQQYLEKENPIDAVILSPYNNQVGLLGQSMRAMRAEQRILTVHKSQGREWDTVILSVSDTYDMFFTDTSDPNGTAINLINTAVSRAKKELVIVCDANFWKAQTNQLITGLIKVGKEYALLTT